MAGAYDDRGRRTSLTRGNGAVTSYSYDNVSRLIELIQNPSGTSHDLTLDFTHNPASQIATNTRSNDSYAWGGHYGVNRSYTANGLNQYTAAGSVNPSYDTRGNVTSAGGTTYGYSSDNMLTSASGGIALTYDPLLRLYETVGGSTTRLAYDGQSLIAEYNGSNTLLRRYVHGPGVDEPIVWYEGTGTSDRRWLHADERGSIVAVSNGSGAVTNINAYDESGIPASTNVGRFQYTGQQWIAELGMYHYRARFYSPTLGRFLQTDPIGFGGGMNLYAYVGNDPVNLIDPSGLSDITVTGSSCRACQESASMDFGGQLGLGGSAAMTQGPTVSENPPPEILVTGPRWGPRTYFGGISAGGGGEPGIGHNNPPESPGPGIIVVGRRIVAIVRGGGGALFFMHSPAGMTREQQDAWERRQLEWQRRRQREGTIDRSEEIRRLRAEQAARAARERAQSRGRILDRVLDIVESIWPGG